MASAQEETQLTLYSRGTTWTLVKIGDSLSSPLNISSFDILSHHLYADDTQIYIFLSSPDANYFLRQFINCRDEFVLLDD